MDGSSSKFERKRSKSKYFITNTKNRMLEYTHNGKIYYFEPGKSVEVPLEFYNKINYKLLQKSEVTNV